MNLSINNEKTPARVMLAIDCSLRWTNVAVAAADGENIKILALHNADIGRRQAAELPSIAERLLNEAGVSKNMLTEIAVTNGPGYFTGVRIGMSFAAALAFGLGINVIPVGTLDALISSYQLQSSDKKADEKADKKAEKPFVLVYAGKTKVYAAGPSLDTGEYDAEYVLKAASGCIVISDEPDKIEAIDKNIIKISPNAEGLVAAAWGMTPASPMNIRANWCRSPV